MMVLSPDAYVHHPIPVIKVKVMDKYGCRIRLCSKLWLQMLWCQSIGPSTTPTQYIIFAEKILQNVKNFNKSFFKFCWYCFIFFINIPTTQYKCAHRARQLLCHSMTWSLYNLIYHFYIVSLLPYGEKNFGQHWVTCHPMEPSHNLIKCWQQIFGIPIYFWRTQEIIMINIYFQESYHIFQKWGW